MRRRDSGIVRDGGRRQLRPGPEAGVSPPVVAVAALRVQHAHPTSAAAQAVVFPGARQASTGGRRDRGHPRDQPCVRRGEVRTVSELPVRH